MQLSQNNPNTVEVCFSPGLFRYILTRENFIVVLADILRATTSICTAFENGVTKIIPVATLEEAKRLKEEGYLVASEQDGKKLDFADFGNSAFNFTGEAVSGKTLAYCTTNGTRALEIARNVERIAIGSFINLHALTGWISLQNRNVVILCSGWKNKFCLEDAVFAGALSATLLENHAFITCCDSVQASMDLWNLAKTDLFGYLGKAAHRERLRKLGLDDVIPYSLKLDQTIVVPVYNGKEITDEGRKKDNNI